MTPKTSQDFSRGQYVEATGITTGPAKAVTDIHAPRQRVALASSAEREIRLRFAPRTVRPTGADIETSR